MWASFGVLGAISPLPLSSLAVTAKSLLQKPGLSDQHWNKHNGEGRLFWDFAQAAMASTHLIEHKVSSTTAAQRAQGAQRMARQLWGDTLSSQRHESWQSLMPTVTSAHSWICFPPKLLIIEMTLMWRGHSSQVTLIHLLSLCFVLRFD